MGALANFVMAVAKPFEFVDDMARDTDDGPGWSAAVDLEHTPDDWLPWLARFNGVRPSGGAPASQQREEIRDAAGFRRGTLGSIEAAAKLHLTGNRTVVITERDGGAYHLTVSTLVAETPDPDQTERDVLTVKPAGLLLNAGQHPGWAYGQQVTFYAGQTYADVAIDFADYAAERANV